MEFYISVQLCIISRSLSAHGFSIGANDRDAEMVLHQQLLHGSLRERSFETLLSVVEQVFPRALVAPHVRYEDRGRQCGLDHKAVQSIHGTLCGDWTQRSHLQLLLETLDTTVNLDEVE